MPRYFFHGPTAASWLPASAAWILREVVQVVDCPRCQELAQRDLSELGVQPDAVEVRFVGDQVAKARQVCGSQLAKVLEQGGERDVAVSLDVGESVEGFEGPASPISEDDRDAWDPVVQLRRDQVADDVARGPAAGRIGSAEPAVRQVAEKIRGEAGGALQERDLVSHGGNVRHRPVLLQRVTGLSGGCGRPAASRTSGRRTVRR